MNAIIIGGNECMGRTYCDLCAKYNITARAIPLKKGSWLEAALQFRQPAWQT